MQCPRVINIRYKEMQQTDCWSECRHRDVLFEIHLKFWNTASIGIPARRYYKVDRLLTGLTAQHKRNNCSMVFK